MSETKNLKLFKHEEPLETNNNKFDIDKALNKNWDKVDDYAGEANSKIDLITEIIGLLPKVSNEGESIALENTARAKFTKFRIEGNSSQETRSGKNKLQITATNKTINGVTFTINEDKTITFKGTNSSSWIEFIISDSFTLQAGTYFIKSFIKMPNGCYLTLRNKTTNTVITSISSVTDISEFTLNEDTIVDVYIGLGNEASYNHTIFPMITINSSDEYEQYGTMPSVEFPSEIKNVTGNVNVTVCNKNLLNQNLTLHQGNYSDDGSFLVNADKRIEDYIFLKKGTYILWAKNNTWINVLIYNHQKQLTNKQNSNAAKQIKFNLNEDGYIRFGFNPIVADLKDFQLEQNTTDTDYVEHKQQTIIFPLAENQKLMKDDYLAEDGIHHKRKQILIDNNKTVWSAVLQDNGLVLTNIAVEGITTEYYDKTPLRFCNLFKNFYSLGNMQNDNLNTVGCALYSQQIWIRSENIYGITTEDSAETRISKVKSYLEKQNLIAEYELAEEEVESYTEAQKEAWKQIKNAISYKGQTNIFSTNEIKPIFEVEALADIGLLLNNIQAQILAGGE